FIEISYRHLICSWRNLFFHGENWTAKIGFLAKSFSFITLTVLWRKNSRQLQQILLGLKKNSIFRSQIQIL
ncbi:MAG TPA: hypothetical protein VNS32_04610, partial [Flavisolibacter sp.]|nr:hypothetical protein [Flavisolibacter sp.]